jgi:ethanolamine ammonia-lyase small subunit
MKQHEHPEAPAAPDVALPGFIPVTPDPWVDLRRLTSARIALGRAGESLPTQAQLAFGLAHARARDAVHASFQTESIITVLSEFGPPVVNVRSAVPDRAMYLRRPDLGRKLEDIDRDSLSALVRDDKSSNTRYDVAFMIADGLSPHAPNRHAAPLLQAMWPRLQDWRIGPLIVAEHARVALGDEIGEVLGARLVIVLIGERPGLSSTDSLGAYLTWDPRVGRTDAERNCVSNIRPEGLGYEAAADTIFGLMQGARRLGLTGVALKDETQQVV